MSLPYRIVLGAIDGFLASFGSVANLLAPTAQGMAWTVRYVDGVLLSDCNMTLDDADGFADETLARPIAWDRLYEFLSSYFQISDCECTGTTRSDVDGPPRLTFECDDATFWILVTTDREMVERARLRPDTIEISGGPE